MQEPRTAPRRMVVKLGTNVIMGEDGLPTRDLLHHLAVSIAALTRAGSEVLVVSSGAIALGMERLRLSERPRDLPMLQACAATGQLRLMNLYGEAFEPQGTEIAQVLLTEGDFRDPERFGNLRSTLLALLSIGVVPIVNENDTISTLEISRPANDADNTPSEKIFGDNDKLSALLMKHIDADLLVLLSDVDGLYDRHPQLPGARLLEEVTSIDDTLRAMAQGGNGRGRGGMSSKIEAAGIAMEAGRIAVIANGKQPGVLDGVLHGQLPGTRFVAMATAAAGGSR